MDRDINLTYRVDIQKLYDALVSSEKCLSCYLANVEKTLKQTDVCLILSGCVMDECAIKRLFCVDDESLENDSDKRNNTC